MVVALIILGVFIIGLIASRNYEKEYIAGFDKKEHPLRAVYPLAAFLYSFVEKMQVKDLFGSSVVLREIYVDETVEKSRKKQAYRCIASMLMVLVGVCVLVLLYTYSSKSYLMDGNSLRRNQTGKGDTNYFLNYSYGESDSYEANIKVGEVRRQGDALERLWQNCTSYLDEVVLGNNESFESISENLDLVKSIPGANVSVVWSDENRWIISTDGSLRNLELSEPVLVTLHATLTYFDTNFDYSRKAVIMPYEVAYSDFINAEIEKKISENDEISVFDEYLQLPTTVNGEEITWSEKEDNTVAMIVVLGIIALVCVVPGLKQDIRKKQKSRRDEMLKDYSDIVSKFIMLLTAGMTCRAAWEKICLDYIKDKSIVKSKRYAYEEMLISQKELQLGKAEVRVYEDFGIRCNVVQYQRFGTLLARNIKRGSSGVISLLELEASEAFADRRESVRRKAEEAGTKLLLPMFGMLIIVFAIVIIPAFSNF